MSCDFLQRDGIVVRLPFKFPGSVKAPAKSFVAAEELEALGDAAGNGVYCRCSAVTGLSLVLLLQLAGHPPPHRFHSPSDVCSAVAGLSLVLSLQLAFRSHTHTPSLLPLLFL